MPIINVRAVVRGQGPGARGQSRNRPSGLLTWLKPCFYALIFTLHCSLFTVAYAMEGTMVVVTKTLIKKGQEIKAGDIGFQEKAFSRMPGDIIQDAGAVIHKTAKRDIQSGIIIRTGMLESKKLVKRGDPVTIVAESGPLVIKTVGQAVEDGSEGKFIKVLNLSSRKIIVGRVVAGSTVSVQF